MLTHNPPNQDELIMIGNGVASCPYVHYSPLAEVASFDSFPSLTEKYCEKNIPWCYRFLFYHLVVVYLGRLGITQVITTVDSVIKVTKTAVCVTILQSRVRFMQSKVALFDEFILSKHAHLA